MKKHPLPIFIVLAISITWLLWIPALIITSSQGYPLPTINYLLQQRSFQFVNSQHVLAVVLFSLAVYGPLLAALIATGLEGGRKAIAAWIAPLMHVRLPARWYLLTLLIALGMVVPPMLVGALIGLVKPQAAAAFPPVLLVLGLFLYQLLTSGLGEEPGWRGYLLPRWQASLGREKAMWWAGLVWAVWHFPFTIYYTLQGSQNMALAAQISILIPALIGQTMSLIAMTYIYAWLLDRTKSLFIAVLFHALGNSLNAVAGVMVIADPIISLAIAAMPWLIVLMLEKTSKQTQQVTAS